MRTGRRKLALTAPRFIRGVTSECFRNQDYNDTTKNLDAYHARRVHEKAPIPTKAELIAHLRDTIEAYADGLDQAAWDIHCAKHLIDMLEKGAI